MFYNLLNIWNVYFVNYFYINNIFYNNEIIEYVFIYM